MVRVNLPFAMVFCLAVALIGCKESGLVASHKPKPLSKTVFTVSYPLEFLTKRIVGAKVNVINAASSQDPETSPPAREVVSQMQSADLIIANGTGATYARWLATVSLPDSKIVNTASRALTLKDFIAVENKQIVHSHGPEGEHSHPVMASRPWLDPAIATKQSVFIASKLKKTYPDLSSQIDSNLKQLRTELANLDSEIRNLQESKLVVLTIDAKFKFLTRAIGADDETLEFVESESTKFVAEVKKLRPDFALIGIADQIPGLQSALEAQGIPIVKVDPMDQKPDSGDFLTEMAKTLQLISGFSK